MFTHLVCCKWSGLAFTCYFNEFGKILDLVGQGNGRRSRGSNHYKLSVLNLSLSLTKISTWCSYQYFSLNQNTPLSSFNLFNPKNSYSPSLAYSKGPNKQMTTKAIPKTTSQNIVICTNCTKLSCTIWFEIIIIIFL